MLIKTDDGILNLVPEQWTMIYVVKRFKVDMEEFWSVKAETQSEDFVLCDCDTKEEAEQALEKLWVALVNNDNACDMT